MQVFHEPSTRAARSPRSLGQMIRDEEMRRVRRVLNTRPPRRRSASYSERYHNTPRDTGIGLAPTPPTVRSRLKSLLS